MVSPLRNSNYAVASIEERRALGKFQDVGPINYDHVGVHFLCGAQSQVLSTGQHIVLQYTSM